MKNIILILFTCISLSAQAQWINQYNNPSIDFYDIEFINNKTGWVCGTGGTILKTTNAGVNWVAQVTNISDKQLLKIQAVNENVLYCVGYFQTILKTINGGGDWTILENGTVGMGSSYTATYFVNENTGWVGGFIGGFIKKTTNGGVNFFNQVLNFVPKELLFKDSSNGIGCSGAATIARTSNGGTNWVIDEYFSQSHGSGNFNSMSFTNDSVGYIAASNRLVYKTTDFGSRWDSISYVYNSLAPQCIKFVNDSVGYCAGSGGEIFITKDKGITWVRQTNSVGGYITSIDGFKDSLWVSATLGKIAFTSNGGVYIQNISTEIPETFNLKQNYPNPFNGQTNIEFEITKQDYYSFEIYNLLGQKLETIFSETKSIGKYRVNYNGLNLSSGTYFYKLSSSEGSIVKSFLLIK